MSDYADRTWSVVYADGRKPTAGKAWDAEEEAFVRSRPTSERDAFGRVHRFHTTRNNWSESVYSYVPTGPEGDASERAAELLAKRMVETHGGTLEPPETTQ